MKPTEDFGKKKKNTEAAELSKVRRRKNEFGNSH